MQTLKFTKMQGLGNDFVLFDFINKTPIIFSVQQLQFLANRKLGIGCDQILLIERQLSNINDGNDHTYNYSIFNADGNKANHCGNGARCVIQYLYNHYPINTPQITLSLNNQCISGYKNHNGTISVNMGHPAFTPATIPFTHKANADNIYALHIRGESITFGIASVGNPHALIQLDNTAELNNTAHLMHIGQMLQNSGYFPDGVNVNFYVVLDKSQLQLRTFERGCGFTEACGSGATATACYAILKHQVVSPVTVVMPGGTLNIEWNTDNAITMTGPANEVFAGQINI